MGRVDKLCYNRRVGKQHCRENRDQQNYCKALQSNLAPYSISITFMATIIMNTVKSA